MQISKNFKSYATYLITGEIRHYLRDKTTIIRAPREIKELSFRVHKLTMELTEKYGRIPRNAAVSYAKPGENTDYDCRNHRRQSVGYESKPLLKVCE